MRAQVITLQAAAGALGAALLGLAVGALWPATWDAPAWLALLAAALDALRVPPPSVRTQVPAYWGRIFGPRAVAVLYGARLGIGPLTILPTWLWWAALALGAAEGPWPSALVGATYAVVRTLTSWLAGEVTTRRGPSAVHRLDGRVRLGVAVAVVAVALAACSEGSDSDEPDDERPARSSTTEAERRELELERSTTTTTTPEEAALEALLLDDVGLEGFGRGPGGPLDLEAAAQAESDPEAERALLRTRRFVGGFDRRFLNEEDHIVYLAVYEFAEGGDAAAYLVDGTETLTARAAEPFDVPIDGAVGFTTVEEGFTAHFVAFTRGPRWFLVLVGSPGGERTADEAIALAARQAA